jgi:hypothetical protein
MNNTSTITIETTYVRFIDGTNVYIPIKSKLLNSNSAILLEHNEFDYEDDSILFEFGFNDTIEYREHLLTNGKKVNLAYKLLDLGDNRNILKRILFEIIQNNCTINDLITLFNIESILTNLTNYDLYKSPYIEIKNWFKINHDYFCNKQ